MARQSAAKAQPPQLTTEELAEGFSQLVAEEIRLGEAQPFLHRVKAVPSISAPYLVGHLVSGGPREREVAALLLQLLAGPRVIVPLRQVLKDTSAPDEARIAAAMVLDHLGEPVAIGTLTSEMHSPMGIFDSIWETVIGRSHGEEDFLESLVQSMEEAPADEREEVIRSLAEPRDVRVLRLLRPLLFSKRSGTVLAAIEAIEDVRGVDATDLLKELSEHDPSPKVRKRARVAYGRLFMMSGPQLPGFDQIPSYPSFPGKSRPVSGLGLGERPLPLHRTLVTLVDGRGQQGVVIARRRADGALKVLSVIVSDTDGVKRCLGAECVREQELSDIEAQLRAEGLTPVEVSLDACRRTLEEARKLQLLRRQRPPMELEVWRGMFAGPAHAGDPFGAAEGSRGSGPDMDLLQALPETADLIRLSEFQQWAFDPGLVWPYVDEWTRAPFEKKLGPAGEETVAGLVTAAIRDLFPEPSRRLWTRRLRRQSWLLGLLGNERASRLAASAAMGMDPLTGIPLHLHPFVRAMVQTSLYNAGLRS